ncbi:MAG: acyltransferase [Ferruginibacter sp.]
MTQHSLTNPYFKNLDAFRFLSFLGVFLSHTLVLPSPTNGISDFLRSFFTMYYLGVPFFFTLSSFLITYRLLAEKQHKNAIDLLSFYKNRILRIWPAYFILLIACFLMLPLLAGVLKIQSPSLPPVLPFLFFYANFYMIEHGVAFTFALTILWSISIEEQFYLVWGSVLKILSKNLALVIILLFVFSIIFSYCYLYVLHKDSKNLAIHSIFVLQNFCTGALIALICIKKESVFVFLKKMPPIIILSVYILLPVAYFFIQDMVLLNIIKSICYSVIIYDQCFNHHRFFNAGRSAMINYLGKISYGLYLYHAIVFVILQKGFNFFGSPQPSSFVNLFQVVVCLAVTFIVAHASYKFVESKFLALKNKTQAGVRPAR